MRLNEAIVLQDFVRANRNGTDTGYWRKRQILFASAEEKSGLAVYSPHASAKRTSLWFTVRSETRITPHNRLLWRDEPYTIVNVTEKDRDLLTVQAVRTPAVRCFVIRSVKEGRDEYKRPVHEPRVVLRFPGILAEKYAGFSQEAPMAESELTFVLIVPKDIGLSVNDLVEVDGKRYVVHIRYELDEYRNEYEIYRKEESNGD